LAALLLAIFLVNVQGSEGGLRSLQEDNKEDKENPSEWLGGGDENATSKNGTNLEGGDGNGDDEDGGDASGNNTVAEEAMETDAPSDSELTANTTTTTTEESPAEETAAAPSESENAPDESENAPDESENTPDESENAPPGEGENAEGDDNIGDDNAGDDDEETEEEWLEEEEEQKEQETKAPYVPPTGDDPFAKEPDESEWSKGEDWKQESPTEMMHDKNVIAALVCAIVIGVVLALCSAQQVIENPNGCCASICRCVVKILCSPCKCCCGGRNRHKHDLMQAGSDSYTHDLELT